MTSLRVALIQTRTPTSQDAALALDTPLIEQAIEAGAQLIVTPEGSNLLQRDRAQMLQAMTPLAEDVYVQGMRALARRHQVWILIGSALVAEGGGKAANRAVLISAEGDIVQTYDKLHMFDVDLPNGDHYRESALYQPGEEARIADTPWGLMGLTICYDMRFPHLYRALAKAGAGIIAVPAAFTRPTGEAHWEVLLRARAIENLAWVVAPAQGGTHENGRRTWGQSLVVDPWGAVVAQQASEEGVVLFDIDAARVESTRAQLPVLSHRVL